MKKILFTTIIGALMLSGCTNAPTRTANAFMKCMTHRDYEKAAYYCGFSKDQKSKEVVVTLILEQFGPNINRFVATGDSIYPDQEHAVVNMDIVYDNNIKLEGYPIYLRKMEGQWVVDPFTIDE